MAAQNLKIKIIFALLLFSFSHFSFADILIEPHLGYIVSGNGDYTGKVTYTNAGVLTTTAVGPSKSKYNGPQVGARIGLQYTPGIMFGLDYTHSTYTLKTTYSDGTPSDNDDYKRSEIGAFVGFSLPILFRAWFTYFIEKETVTKSNASSGAVKGDNSDGHTLELGLGYTGFPLVSFNLLYRIMSYDSGNSSGIGAYTFTPNYKEKEIVLGVSIPFTL